MRNCIIILVLLYYSLGIKAQCHGDKAFISNSGSYEYKDAWILVFEDNFDSNKLDESKWSNTYPWGRTLICNDEDEYYTNGDNIQVNNGILKLIAKKERVYEKAVSYLPDNEELDCNGESVGNNKRWFNYTSGMIYSKKSFTHGKFEIRCKIPSIKKLWPAFWLYGECGQEIDVFEFMSESNNSYLANRDINFTYHRKINCNDKENKQCGSNISFLKPPGFGHWDTDMSKNFHTYSIEWDNQKLIWRIDGEEVYRIVYLHDLLGREVYADNNLANGMYIYDKIFPLKRSMSIIANLAVLPNSNANFPTSMDIDYIRVYQQINTNKPEKICNYSVNVNGTDIVASKIEIGGNNCTSIIKKGQSVSFLAEEIKLNSYFKSEYGSNLIIKSQPLSLESNKIHNKKNNFSSKVKEEKKQLKTQDLENKISLYPNPNNGNFTIQTSQIGNDGITVQVLSISGASVSQDTYHDNKINIDISNQPAGIYIVKIINGSEVTVKRIMKK